jgi:hypothetical protein
MFLLPSRHKQKMRRTRTLGWAAALTAVLLISTGCAQKKKSGNFSVVDNRPVPQSYVYNNETYTVLLKPAGGGAATVEVSGMAYSLAENPTDRTRAERVGAQYLAGRGQCGAGIAPLPISGSQVFNAKHEYWSVGYRCT